MVINIAAESRVSATAPPEHDPNDSDPWEDVRARLETMAPETHEIVQYLFDLPLTVFTADLPAYAAESFTPGRPMLAAALDLMSRIHEDFRYDTTVTDASTPVDRVFEMRAGVCQDLAHVGIAAMRSLGLPARYVSGYLLTRPPPGQERLIGADASHAWFSVWAPPFGWVDLDPTNNLIPGEGHITVGMGPRLLRTSRRSTASSPAAAITSSRSASTSFRWSSAATSPMGPRFRGTRAFPIRFAHKENCVAGAGGFEPPNAGIKIRCLTTWLRPNAPGNGPGRGP